MNQSVHNAVVTLHLYRWRIAGLTFSLLFLFFTLSGRVQADDGKIFNGMMCKSANNVSMSVGFKGEIKNLDPTFYSTVICPVVRDSMSSFDSAKKVEVAIDDRNFSSNYGHNFSCSWRSLQWDGDIEVYRSLPYTYGTFAAKTIIRRNLPYCTGSCIGGAHWSYVLVCNVPQRYGSSGYSSVMSYRVYEEN